MNKPLFKDLYKLLYTVLDNINFTDTIFLHYLTGFSSPETFDGICYDSFTDKVLNHHANLHTIFADQYLTYELKVLNKKITLSYGFMVSLSCNT